MIVIINGPLGIGKSETSWQLMFRFERAAMLDVDHIAAFHPFDFYNQAHLDYAHSLIGTLATYHVAHGISDLVINWVIESPAQLERITHVLAGCELPIYAFRLTCDQDEIERRIHTRNRSDLAFEIERSRHLSIILDTAARTGSMGEVIDTTKLTINQVVDTIWEHIHANAQKNS